MKFFVLMNCHVFLTVCCLYCAFVPVSLSGTKTSSKIIASAVCILKGRTQGKISFSEYDNRLTKIHGFVSGLVLGKHGIHVHQFGDLTAGCLSTGAHYNPKNYLHASPDDNERHVGDLGNIKAGVDEWAEVYKVDKQIRLTGDYSVIGRALVVHELEDDLGKGNSTGSATTGNAGGRIDCCIIGHAK